MKIKNVVKVMNFHSLLRVDKARKEAEKYFRVESELRRIINVITNNRNFVLDKKLLSYNASGKPLNIYVGSDLGFCAGYNTVVNDTMRQDASSDKIVIGKKIHASSDGVLLKVTKESYMADPSQVNEILVDSIRKQTNSSINILYNEYINAGEIVWKEKRVYPLEAFKDDNISDYKEDYVCETDATVLLINLIVSYIMTEIQLTVKNSFASENIMRQNATTESLKRIDEIEEKERRQQRKERVAEASAKVTESYTRQKFSEGGL